MATKINVPSPQDKIGESFVWRDWFQKLSDKVFGDLAAQNADSVNITGGSISGINLSGNNITNAHITNSFIDSSPIGMSSPSTGHFTSLQLDSPLAIAYGGTNTSATPTLGGIAYGTGSALAYSVAGAAGQFLTSTGGAAPTCVESELLVCGKLGFIWVFETIHK